MTTLSPPGHVTPRPTPHSADIQAALERADQLLEEAFPAGRTPRSEEYRAGVLRYLRFALAQIPVLCPYDTATAQADAFLAGIEEGKLIARRKQDR